MKKFIYKIKKIIISGLLWCLPILVMAQNSGGNTGGTPVAGNIGNPLKDEFDSIPKVLNEIFHTISEIGAVLLAVMIVYSGFLFVTAAGNDEKLKKAKESIKYVIIGGVIVLGAWSIAELVHETLVGPMPVI